MQQMSEVRKKYYSCMLLVFIDLTFLLVCGSCFIAEAHSAHLFDLFFVMTMSHLFFFLKR